MTEERRGPLSESLRRIFDRGKQAHADPPGGQAGEPPQAEPGAPRESLQALSLQEFLRYAHVLAAADTAEISDLREALAEFGRRLVDAQQDEDIASLHDAARRLERRRRALDAGQADDRLLGRSARVRPPRDDRRSCGYCMCSLEAPDGEQSSPLGG